MNKFFLLTKTFFLSGFNVNKKKGNQKSAFKTLIIFGVLGFLLAVMYSSSLMLSVGEFGGSYEDVLMLFVGAGSLIVLFISIQQMQGVIFKTKDYEFLESLPINKKTIVAAKIMGVYLIALYEDIIIILPSILVYLIFTGNFYIGLLVFIFMFFASIGPILLGSLLGSLISLLTSRMKHQNIFTIVLYVIFFVGIMLFSTLISNPSFGANYSQIYNVLPYLLLIKEAFDFSKIYLFILLILGHIIAFIVSVVFISAIYRPMNTYLGNVCNHSEYIKGAKIKKKTLSQVLLKKELKMISSNAQYAVNSFLGPIMYVVCGLMMMFMGYGEDVSLEDATMISSVMAGVSVSMGILMNFMASSTTASISLEAKQFEMLMVYPVNPKEIIKAKLKASLLITTVMNIIAGSIIATIITIKNGFNIWIVISSIILPICASTYTGVVGMICGLRWPKLDFENQMQAIKNSAAANFQMLFTAVPGLFIMGINILFNILGSYFNNILTMFSFIVPLVLLLVMILISYKILKNKGVSLFNQVISR